MPHDDIPDRAFEIGSGIAGVLLLGAVRGPLDPAVTGALAASLPDLEHVFRFPRPGGRKLFPSHRLRGWHGRGGVSAGAALPGRLLDRRPSSPPLEVRLAHLQSNAKPERVSLRHRRTMLDCGFELAPSHGPCSRSRLCRRQRVRLPGARTSYRRDRGSREGSPSLYRQDPAARQPRSSGIRFSAGRSDCRGCDLFQEHE